jgi:hypothetical protein
MIPGGRSRPPPDHEPDMIELDDVIARGKPVPELEAPKPFQSALLEAAIATLSDHFDDASALLCHPVNRGFKPIRESLCYAALLLVRNRCSHVTDSGLLRARKVIDAVLARQNRNIHGASGGAFPLAWSREKRSGIMDPDSRQIIGSLLAVLARDFSLELGRARVDAMRGAIALAVRGEDPQRLQSTHQRALKTWLEIECGDRLLGEELLIELTDQDSSALALARFGQPQAFGYEIYANALWCASPRLGSWGERLYSDVLQDVVTSLHPSLHQLLGGGLSSRMFTEGDAAWINVWLTWLAMGSNPLLPREMANPLDATLYAFPALTQVANAAASATWDDGKRQINRAHQDRSISAWFEQALHLEACQSAALAPGTQPVVAAFWRQQSGIASLTCHATGSHQAQCDGRSVRLQDPGKCRISITGLGRGATRLVEDGWQLPGLRLTCRGFEIGDAQRTEDGLDMILRPLRDHGLLVFSPAS